jgi:glycosyltransferase involved in cell wall biosynthesis
MRILAVTNMYPTPQNQASGIFVEQQIKGLRQIGLEVEVCIVDRTSKGMGAYWGASAQIRAKVVRDQPDVVHVMYGGVLADITTRAVYHTPVVVSFCGSDLLGEPLAGSLRRWLASYGVWASHRAVRRARGIVVKSRNLQDALPDYVNPLKIRIIPNGIDLDRFKPLDRHTCRDQLRWHASRFHVLFASPAGASCKRPELARAAVQALNGLGIDAELHQLAGVPHHEVPVWLNASNVLLLTSLTEGSPNIVKEALACDLPVVSVEVGDVGERIRGIEGCYLGLSEPGDLAAKLHMVHAGTGRVAGRGKIQELSLKRVALRLREFYSELLESWGKKGEASF